MENTTERLAADTLLERGVRVSIPAPLLFRLFRKRTITLRIYQPYYGTLRRISAYYLSTGITDSQLKEIEQEEALNLAAKHGRTLCKVVATAILNGFVSGWLFTRPLSWFLLWGIKPKMLCYLVELLVIFSGTADFMSTTRSVKLMKITAPRTGQKAQGS